MPTNERSNDYVAEQIELLENQQTELQESYDKQEISKPEFTKAMDKLNFQLAQIKARNEQSLDQEKARGNQITLERRRDLFHD